MMSNSATNKIFRKSSVAIMCHLALFGGALNTAMANEPAVAAPTVFATKAGTIALAGDSNKVKQLLAVPMAQTMSAASAIAGIDITNTTDVSAASDAAAVSAYGGDDTVTISNSGMLTGGIGIEANSAIEDVTVVNSGDIKAGNGISVTTSQFDAARSAAAFDTIKILDVLPARDSGYAFLYDDAGNHITEPGYDYYGNPIDQNVSVFTDSYVFTTDSTIYESDFTDATIVVDNSGNIEFSEDFGIVAENVSGAAIAITNTGDIAISADATLEPYTVKAGISATVDNTYYRSEFGTPQIIEAGDIEYNDILRPYSDNYQITGVNVQNQVVNSYVSKELINDSGDITINNSGNINMRNHTDAFGILAIADGNIAISNSGNIAVDHFSYGIKVSSTGGVMIENSGDITIGNHSSGINVSVAYGTRRNDYHDAGDVYVLNTGDISGGLTKAELADTVYAASGVSTYGIAAFALGTNNQYTVNGKIVSEKWQRYNEILGEDVFPSLGEYANTRIYDTTVINQGNITLADGGRGILMGAKAGAVTAINDGTISVGDGSSILQYNVPAQSGGIFINAHWFNGISNLYSINTENGIIITGDDSAGIRHWAWYGSSTVVNEGYIKTGSGDHQTYTRYGVEGEVDGAFLNYGIDSIVSIPATYQGSINYVLNAGEIHTGDLSVGIHAGSYSSFDPQSPYLGGMTGYVFNTGVIESGDNSSGILHQGFYIYTYNSGSVSIGDFDISNYNPGYAAVEDLGQNSGIHNHVAGAIGVIINNGDVTTGHHTNGLKSSANLPSSALQYVIQGEAGTIHTGDYSNGINVEGGGYGVVINQGSITTGNQSSGIKANTGGIFFDNFVGQVYYQPGYAHVINSGIIETGDNSIGIEMDNAQFDVPFYFNQRIPYSYPSQYQVFEGSTDVIGVSYLNNSGEIHVGENSIGVLINGVGAGYQFPLAEYKNINLYNTGVIDASHGVAISSNANNDLGSVIVNTGTITGDIVTGAGDDFIVNASSNTWHVGSNSSFGDGDDVLVNTVNMDANGNIIDQGNIVMSGSTIDFGAGNDTLRLDRSTITLAGGENVIKSANLESVGGFINAINNDTSSSLTIDGNLSGDVTFAADISNSASDQLIVNGDLLAGSSVDLILNPTEQLKGDVTIGAIKVGGENHGTAQVQQVTGAFADTLQNVNVTFDQASGEFKVVGNFGLSHLGSAVMSANIMAGSWWQNSIANAATFAGNENAPKGEKGITPWGSFLHEEGSVNPLSNQNLSFNQTVTGLQFGVDFNVAIGDSSLTVSPFVSSGMADSSLNANFGSAEGDMTAYGVVFALNASNGLALKAAYLSSDADLTVRNSLSAGSLTGETSGTSKGYLVNVSYGYALESGLTLTPHLQYSSADVDVDDLTVAEIYQFSAITADLTTLNAGLTVGQTFITTNGTVTPLASLSYMDVSSADNRLITNSVDFDASTAGNGFKAELGLLGTYNQWDLGLRMSVTDTDAYENGISTNLSIRYSW
jgi:hypothetical protein